MFFRLFVSVGQTGGSISHGDSEICLCPTLVTRRRNIFLYFFTELKTHHLSYFHLYISF